MLKYMKKQHDDEVALPPMATVPKVPPEEIGGDPTLSKNRYDAATFSGHETASNSSSSSSSRSSSHNSCDSMQHKHDMASLPSSSTSWRGSDGIAHSDEKRCTSATGHQKVLPSTPPLSPSSSVVSDTLNRSSSSSFTDAASFPRGKTGMTTAAIKPAMPFASGDECFVTGPPIIPRSKTPPPPPLLPLQRHQLHPEESSRHHPRHLKSIFDSDDDDNDDNEVTDVDFELFFNEFSRQPPEQKSKTNKRKSIKVRRMSKFNLTAFANHLHDNRLSVMQLRESRILLTDEDELELMRLLEQRKSMTPGSALPPPSAELPPLPKEPLPPMPAFGGDKELVESEPMTAQHQQPPVVVVSDEHKVELTPATTLTKKASRRRQAVRKSLSMDEIRQMAAGQEKTLVGDMEPIQEDAVPATEQQEQEDQVQQQHVPLSSPPAIVPEPSVSTSFIKSKFEMANSKRAKAIGLFGSLRQATSRSTPFKGLVRNLSSASLSARYSQGAKAAQQKEKEQRQKEKEQEHEQEHRHRLFHHKKKGKGDAEDASNNMSPAARSVMQLDKKKKGKSSKKDEDKSDTTEEVTRHTSLKGGLLTHLLAKAGKARRTKTVNMASTSSKRGDKTKSRIVRRTIIYVPPDSLNFLNNLEQKDTLGSSSGKNIDDQPASPPLPTDMTEKLTLHRMGASEEQEQQEEEGGGGCNYYDDESLYDYYRNRESSVTTTATHQLEGLELRELEDGTVEWGIVKQQGNRRSFYAHGQQDYAEEEDDEDKVEEHVLKMMGLSVPSTLSLSSSPPPPLPRRSPRRRLDSEQDRAAKHISTITASDASTTDVYYAPQQTLPSLLQMIADQEKEEEEDEQAYLDERRKKQASVEEQLDDMMRSFQRVDYK